MKDNENELLPVVDVDGRQIATATRGECHCGTKLLHPVVHLHVFDSSGRLYLQRRPDWKDIQPGRWDTAVGGHMDPGETVEQALRREAREELGLVDFDAVFVARYVFESDREKELVNVFRAVVDVEPSPSAELDGGRFWTAEELRHAIAAGNLLTPNFTSEYTRLFLMDRR